MKFHPYHECYLSRLRWLSYFSNITCNQQCCHCLSAMILFLCGNCTHTTPFVTRGPSPLISTFDIYPVPWEDVDHFVHVTHDVVNCPFVWMCVFLQMYLVLFPKPDFKILKSLIYFIMFKFPERRCWSIIGPSMIFHAFSLSG